MAKGRLLLWLRHYLASLVPIAIFLSILMAPEAGSWLYLRYHSRQTHPFLVSPKAISSQLAAYQQNWGDNLVVSYVDPLLGFAHDPSQHPLLKGLPGFVAYGNAKLGDDALLVVCLGGSTTDPLTPLFLKDSEANPADPYNWPKLLAEKIVKSGRRVTVLNGGVAGYNSNQEMTKVLRDVLPLHPNLVVALDGVNEFYGHRLADHPMLHPYQKKLVASVAHPTSSWFYPNFLEVLNSAMARSHRTVTGYTLGLSSSMTAAEQWKQNIRAIHAISKEFNMKHVVYLQPIQGFAEYNPTADENAMLTSRGEEYITALKVFYSGATPFCRETEFCSDLTNIFADERKVYLDARHQNERGVQILSDAIYADLQRRHYLESR